MGGLTQAELAGMVGASQTFMYENGEVRIAADVVAKIALWRAIDTLLKAAET